MDIVPAGRSPWSDVALKACYAAPKEVECPRCYAVAVSASWNLVDFLRRSASIDLQCRECDFSEIVNLVLPRDLPAFFPLDRVEQLTEVVTAQIEPIKAHIRKCAAAMPAAAFATHQLWAEAKWNATTFQWHPTSEAPPIMGLVFDNAEAGKEIFREAERQMNHSDRFEEIRVSIIEGPVPGQELRPGYSVHICPDSEALAAHATMGDFVIDPSIVPFMGQWNRHYPIPGMPALLPRFKKEFAKHKEFLLAPVVRRADGQLYAEPLLGIIKNIVTFRYLSEITTPDDPDSAALILPQLITPPR